MNRHTAILIAGSILTLDVSLARPAAAQPVLLPVYLTVSNQAAVPADVMAVAVAEVIRIYAAIGVTVVWTDDVSRVGGRSLFVSIIPERLSRRNVRVSALGTAIVGGTLASVVFERVERFSLTWGNNLRMTLGHAIAHEMGHLLLGDGSHAAEGLMRARWDLVDARIAAVGRLLFTSAEAARIRKDLAARQ